MDVIDRLEKYRESTVGGASSAKAFKWFGAQVSLIWKMRRPKSGSPPRPGFPPCPGCPAGHTVREKSRGSRKLRMSFEKIGDSVSGVKTEEVAVDASCYSNVLFCARQ
jgi:hypothetical protein